MKKESKKLTIKDLEAEVRKHNRLYFVENAPEISDYEFDRLVEELRVRKPDSQALKELVSDVQTVGKKVEHVSPMLSLDKCYDEKALLSWEEKFQGGVIVSPKIDGCAVSIRYGSDGKLVLAATRGDGVTGEDITPNVRHIESIPEEISDGDVEIRGEIYMPISVFDKYKDRFANPRNLAAGAVKQKDPRKTGEYNLSFFAYDILGLPLKTQAERFERLQKMGFVPVEWRCVGRDEMQAAFEDILERRSRIDYELDGVVFRTNLISEQNKLGSTAHHPRYAIAYKFQGDSGMTTLIDVEWSVSRTGAITPVAIVEPVELSGAMVRRASLHNIGIMKNLNLTRGAKVLMMRRGGVIPNLESIVENGEGKIAIPKRCPSCGSDVKLEDDFLYCTNSDSCLKSKIGELEHFVKAMGIDGFGEKLIARLYEEGMATDASEFYELEVDDLMGLERMGDTLANKLVSNVAASRRVTLATFLQSLGIRELGKHAAKILAAYGSMDRLFDAAEDELSSIKTIGPIIAREVVSGLKDKRTLIDKLLKHVEIEVRAEVRSSWKYAGKSFLFTGKMLAMARSEAQERVEGLGGQVASSVNKDLDFLIVGDGGGAGSKLAKAEKLKEKGEGVSIVSEKDFLEFLE